MDIPVTFVDITITIVPPVTCNQEQVQEWIDFQLGLNDSISIDNPLVEHELELKFKKEGSPIQYKTRIAH